MTLEADREGRIALGPTDQPRFFAWPLPQGLRITLHVGTPDDGCRHAVVIPPDGFVAPAWCFQALEAVTARIDADPRASICAGSGTLWDGHASASDADVTVTLDPSAGACALAEPVCTIGDAVVTDRGDGLVDPPGLHFQIDLPIEIATWREGHHTSLSRCPDPKGHPAAGDRDVDHGTTTLRLTTATATSSKATSDACLLEAKSQVVGTPPGGPCCEVGQSMLLVATGFNRGAAGVVERYAARLPMVVTACAPAGMIQPCTVPDLECRPPSGPTPALAP